MKKILSLLEENVELKSQLKVQHLQSESRLRVQELEFQVEQLVKKLDQSEASLREASVYKERLEKRITELEHRSRLLEDRAKAIADGSTRKLDAESIRAIAAEVGILLESQTGNADRPKNRKRDAASDERDRPDGQAKENKSETKDSPK